MASESKPYIYEETAQHKPQVPTGITGKPIKYEHDALTNVQLGDGGAGFTAIGANTLPFRYTDDSLVKIPIKLSDIYGPGGKPDASGKDELAPPEQQQKKKGGFFRRLSGTPSSSKKDATSELKVVPMSRGDYLKYWAKGDDGKYLPDVVEPPEGRAAFVEDMLDRFKDRM